MKYSRLGDTGLVVSRLTLGAMTFGSGEMWGFKFTVDQKSADELVGRAIDGGVNFFDTADVYAFGASEEILGRALGKRRKDVVIATKVGGRMSDALTDAGLSFRHILSAAEASLRRLNTDYIDLYQVHFDDRITPIDETLRALDNLVRRGLVRYVGFSNFPAWKAAEAVGLQRLYKYTPFVSAQVYYSLLGRDVEHEIIPFARHAGIGIMVWSPLAGGLLSGKYTSEDPKGGGGRLATFDFPPVDRDLGYTVVDTLKGMANAHGATAAAVALAWVLSKPAVTSVIVGVTSLRQLNENLEAVNVHLSAEELSKLDQSTSPPLLYPGWMYARPSDPAIERALQTNIAEVSERLAGEAKKAGVRHFVKLSAYGAEALTYFDVVSVLSRAAGKEIRYISPTAGETRARAQAFGASPFLREINESMDAFGRK